MEASYQVLLVAVALLLVLLGAWLQTRWRALRERTKARGAAKKGLQGERDAEKLLKKLGYKVLMRHPAAGYGMAVDGAPQAVQLTADYLLELKGKRVLAEVKTGKAAKLDHAETRRQLLEYQLAFGVDTLLLIDMDGKQVKSVRFPLPTPKDADKPVVKKRATLRWAAIALLALAATTWILARASDEAERVETQ